MYCWKFWPSCIIKLNIMLCWIIYSLFCYGVFAFHVLFLYIVTHVRQWHKSTLNGQLEYSIIILFSWHDNPRTWRNICFFKYLTAAWLYFPNLFVLTLSKIETTTGRKCLETNKGVTSIFYMNINKQEAIGDISFPSIIANIYSRFRAFSWRFLAYLSTC